MRRVAIAIALIACGPSATPIERAQAAERGHGRTRDYRAAAELYRSACDLGKGDVDACGALIRAQLVGRGTAADRQAAKMLAGTLCMNRRDPFGCTAADMLSGSEAQIPPPLMDAIKATLGGDLVCDAGHPSACYATLLGSALDFNDSSSAEERRREREMTLCNAGVVEGCAQVVQYQDDRDRDSPEVHAASDRLQRECNAGDADACAHAPDRKPVPDKELCAAFDYVACARLGCAGDAAAAKLAADNEIDARRVCRPGRN